ncbi:hypothetical protein GCM10010967_41960 [Dyadobacter beijingensis]|uniref:HTH cro/C1-type domain-containing protein n=1 Tax=Dyadobacter beijingensis TaxID=365489 RepID=A0ABQ2I7N5_9BACT|nr:helix-turn-helix transcriptional regulator [Dyadobacter beijingensis]GGN02939.1 hypothetical protein GCM10010967_41960 [Dyadobacter beijingensis]
MEALAKKLRAKRESKGFSVAYMASSLGISEELYSDIETGRTDPTADLLKQISLVLGSTVPGLMANRPVHELAVPAGQFSPESLNEMDKDTYIKILENQLRVLLAEKRGS